MWVCTGARQASANSLLPGLPAHSAHRPALPVHLALAVLALNSHAG